MNNLKKIIYTSKVLKININYVTYFKNFLPYLMEKQYWRRKSFSLELMFPRLTIEMGEPMEKHPRPKQIQNTMLENTIKIKLI
jgi:hypothetical protein